MLKLCFILSFLFVRGNFEPVTFNGHKVVRVIPATDAALLTLDSLLRNASHLDVWRYPTDVNVPVDIRVSPVQYDDVIRGLHDAGLEARVVISDVQAAIHRQTALSNRLTYRRKVADFEYFKYHTLDEIWDWMKNITNVYKDRASLFNVTKSYEGRPLTGIKISTSTKPNKPAFWIEGGIHAREWIAPATVVFMAGQMLDEYKFDLELTKVVDMFDWYILPVTNPDGYVYTWEKNRLWRKTRSKHGLCYGVDPNRNWDFHWCESGASRDPCSETYCGPKAFSESEVKGVADFLLQIGKVKGFIDFHSYSQMWMSPWGYTKTLPKDFGTQDSGSLLAVQGLKKVYDTKYTHGSLARTVYISSGSSADWTYGKAGIKYSYGVELRDTGKYGFLLPEDQIIPSGKETLEALVKLAEYVNINDSGSLLAVQGLKKVYDTKYIHGSLARTVYISSGSSADWTYGKAGIKYSYGVELRDTGKYGFLLPEDQIIPSGKETLEALVKLAEYVNIN